MNAFYLIKLGFIIQSLIIIKLQTNFYHSNIFHYSKPNIISNKSKSSTPFSKQHTLKCNLFKSIRFRYCTIISEASFNYKTTAFNNIVALLDSYGCTRNSIIATVETCAFSAWLQTKSFPIYSILVVCNILTLF